VPATPPSNELVVDTFSRAATSGWGGADIGGSYTLLGSSGAFAVQGGVGQVTVPVGNSRGATLYGASTRDVDMTVKFATDVMSRGDGQFVYLIARRATDGSEYRLKVRLLADGRVLTGLSKTSNGVEAPIEVGVDSGLSYVAGSYLHVRASVTGASPTTLKVKVWRAGQAEPTGWQVTATDATSSLQDAGAVGIQSYVAGNGRAATLSIDDLVVIQL
jgi:hypothetical protein